MGSWEEYNRHVLRVADRYGGRSSLSDTHDRPTWKRSAAGVTECGAGQKVKG